MSSRASVAKLASRRACKSRERWRFDGGGLEAGRREPTRNNLTAIKAAWEKDGVAFVDNDKQLGIVAPR